MLVTKNKLPSILNLKKQSSLLFDITKTSLSIYKFKHIQQITDKKGKRINTNVSQLVQFLYKRVYAMTPYHLKVLLVIHSQEAPSQYLKRDATTFIS